MNPRVSVIIPAYNAAEYITQTINSVLAQSFKDFEIIVIDDGSTDNTAKVLENFKNQIQYIKKQNAGPASARNLGISLARGEFIAFLDSDDLWQPTKLQKQIEIFQKDSGVGLVHTATKIINAHGQENTDFKKNTNKETLSFIDLFKKNHIAASSVLIRTACLKKSGVFDEDKSVISLEDYDLWLRIAADYKIAFISESLLLYRVHSSGISRNIERSYTAEEKVIRKIATSYEKKFPKVKRILNKRLAQIYFECGSDYFYILDFDQARGQFKQSLGYNFFQPKALMFFILSLLPASWIVTLKTFRKSEKK